MEDQAQPRSVSLVGRNRVGVVVGLAAVAVASVGLSLAMGAGSAGSDEQSSLSSPSLDHGPGSQVPAGARTPPTTSGGEARRLHSLDPTRVERSVASDDAAAATSGPQHQAAKGVWHVGEVGTYLVGRGIAPGRYESAAPTSGSCRWARLRGLGGDLADDLERGTTTGRSVVTVRATDSFFQTTNCQNWHKVS